MTSNRKKRDELFHYKSRTWKMVVASSPLFFFFFAQFWRAQISIVPALMKCNDFATRTKRCWKPKLLHWIHSFIGILQVWFFFSSFHWFIIRKSAKRKKIVCRRWDLSFSRILFSDRLSKYAVLPSHVANILAINSPYEAFAHRIEICLNESKWHRKGWWEENNMLSIL